VASQRVVQALLEGVVESWGRPSSPLSRMGGCDRSEYTGREVHDIQQKVKVARKLKRRVMMLL
jgi:hypothetical protein